MLINKKLTNKKKQGFTLIELLVAVAISLILMSSIIGTFLNYLD